MAQEVARLERAVVAPSVGTLQRALPRARWLFGRFGLHLLAIVVGAALMLPLFWAVSSSLKAAHEVRQLPPVWFPSVPQWQNYPADWSSRLFAIWTWNSTFLTIVGTVGTVLSSSIGGYAFARFRFPGKRLLFSLTLATLLLPGYVLLIPNYLLFWKLGWLNTYLPLTVPHFFGSAFFIFLFRQFFLTIPLELDEAARIDGASYPRIFWSIVLPLSGPVFATAAIIESIRQWNSFLWPLIILNQQSSFPLAVGLRYLRTNVEESGPKDHLLMAGAVMMAVPVIVIFFLGQRYFVRGIAMTGIKG
jgi:multiple sugar transport system permease protein/sn-glycerol 3-phosphate transport system permease protein